MQTCLDVAHLIRHFNPADKKQRKLAWDTLKKHKPELGIKRIIRLEMKTAGDEVFWDWSTLQLNGTILSGLTTYEGKKTPMRSKVLAQTVLGGKPTGFTNPQRLQAKINEVETLLGTPVQWTQELVLLSSNEGATRVIPSAVLHIPDASDMQAVEGLGLRPAKVFRGKLPDGVSGYYLPKGWEVSE